MTTLRIVPVLLSLLWLSLTNAVAVAQPTLQYLPENISYDPSIPTPDEVLGFDVGEWHVRHDQLVNYMRAIADASPRVSLIETGQTHEKRPLLLLAITAEDNQANLQSMRQRHLDALAEGNVSQDLPLVLYMGYSVHGNEPSGSNAALLVAYYLAAAQGAEIDALLGSNIVLLDPSLNPDGLSRFAQWANMHKGRTLVADPQHREHIEDWPSGRTNHYWFDLNRDWLLLTHPESRARITQFHRWRPHVLTDFHEMGTNSTYFFQPGIASRKNPWTPDENVRLTQSLANFHAEALDKDKQLYFTQESFDDFYYGKGSTYPDAHGSVGILFEQASSRGHLQDSINGPLSFPRTIQNQVTTSLSTFAGAVANKQALLDYQRAFKDDTEALIKDDKQTGYLVQSQKDAGRLAAFRELLDYHQIRYRGLKKTHEQDNQKFDPARSLFIPLNQPQYRLIKSMFSERKRFNDNTFYDVSNWNLALAFNLEYSAVTKNLRRNLTDAPNSPRQTNNLSDNAYAYAFEWHHAKAPALLQTLLSYDVAVRIAGEPFSAKTSQGQISFAAGTVVVPLALTQPDALVDTLKQQADKFAIKVWSIESGLTREGIDLGSRKMQPVEAPKVLLVGGRSTSQYEVGEIWHYLDQRVEMPVSIVEASRLGRVSLDGYSHVIFADGNYTGISETTRKQLTQWVRNGGVLIGQKGATKWFSQQKWLKAEFLEQTDIDAAFEQDALTYADKEAFAAKKRIAGAVFETRIDTSHPLAFGIPRARLPMFKNAGAVLLMPEKPFVSVAKYTDTPLMAGYAADEMTDLISNTAAVVAHNVGKGKVIGFVDNVNFRGYWYGTSRLLSNAIFMSGFIDAKG